MHIPIASTDIRPQLVQSKVVDGTMPKRRRAETLVPAKPAKRELSSPNESGGRNKRRRLDTDDKSSAFDDSKTQTIPAKTPGAKKFPEEKFCLQWPSADTNDEMRLLPVPSGDVSATKLGRMLESLFGPWGEAATGFGDRIEAKRATAKLTFGEVPIADSSFDS